MNLATDELTALRIDVREHHLECETKAMRRLILEADLTLDQRQNISSFASDLVRKVRTESTPTLMEKFLAQYGLSTNEGIALMCLAEALLRVPDKRSIDALIEDKLASGDWQAHCGQSPSALINSSSWALLMTGKLLAPVKQTNLTQTLRSLVKRFGEPVIRGVVAQAMKEMGHQFVLGRDIGEAIKRSDKYQQQGYSYSYDMLGEAAWTVKDAQRYFNSYKHAITVLSQQCKTDDLRGNPGISVKLSALHPRYEITQKQRVMDEVVPRVLELAKHAKAANIGFTVDAEEAERLDISLDVIEAVLSSSELKGWDGFGVVVQAFGPRAMYVLDWLYALITRLDRNIMLRLVKGAYWDREIKRAQVTGLKGFPVFTRKVNSDISYIACAKKLLTMSDRIFAQFATHNAHTVAAILELNKNQIDIEFQRLHGMGESLYEVLPENKHTRHRIYAPVGEHVDLLAYLVRRLLENGANSSFVNQIVDPDISPEIIAADPFSFVDENKISLANPSIDLPKDIFLPERTNSRGWDVFDALDVDEIYKGMETFRSYEWRAAPMIGRDLDEKEATEEEKCERTEREIFNPAKPEERVGCVSEATAKDISSAFSAAQSGLLYWRTVGVEERQVLLLRVAELYEENAYELFALISREAGKNIADAIAELREAVDFARYYGSQIDSLPKNSEGRGIISCISPWNFPLAILSGQIFSALAAGNTVLAKPAEQTSLIAAKAVALMHQAGIPKNVIQLLPGEGKTVGAAICSTPGVAGVCFTGSCDTAKHINRAMAENLPADVPLIAETGGINAMIVDSTALPEQVVNDVLASSFQSAGQRCSALRMLYIQKDVYKHFVEMLFGAMDELKMGDPIDIATDVGPLIDTQAKQKVFAHCEKLFKKTRLSKSVFAHQTGHFVPPTVIEVDGINDLESEIFGPVLHVASFDIDELDTVINDINNKSYGLTFGVHSRVDSRIDYIVEKMAVGNIYVNRNQIGAIVGSQPFGGEGLSGTGPKAGGPNYLQRFTRFKESAVNHTDTHVEDDSDDHSKNNSTRKNITAPELEHAINSLQSNRQSKIAIPREVLAQYFEEYQLPSRLCTSTMPGATGELNELSYHPRGLMLCFGPSINDLKKQTAAALSQGNSAILIAECKEAPLLEKLCEELPVAVLLGRFDAELLESVEGIAGVVSFGGAAHLKALRITLAKRSGALIPLITELSDIHQFVLERHLCIDTTAAGGNASLIAKSA